MGRGKRTELPDLVHKAMGSKHADEGGPEVQFR